MDNFLTGRRENYRGVLDGDITERSVFYTYANELEPELVIHCAASYKDPDLWHRTPTPTSWARSTSPVVAKHHNARIIYFQTVLPPDLLLRHLQDRGRALPASLGLAADGLSAGGGLRPPQPLGRDPDLLPHR